MSTAADIRAAVADAVAALDLAEGLVVRKAKRPVYKSGDPAVGVVVVSGVDLGAEPLTAEDGFARLVRYGVAVTVVRPNQAKEVPDGVVEGWAELIRGRLTGVPNPVPAVPAVCDVRQADRPWFNPAGLDRNYDYWQLSLVFEAIEARG